jgi:hypothetical protein
MQKSRRIITPHCVRVTAPEVANVGEKRNTSDLVQRPMCVQLEIECDGICAYAADFRLLNYRG